MGFCPFLSLKISGTVPVEVIAQDGTVYTRSGGVFMDGANGIGDNAPTAMVSATQDSGAEIISIQGADGNYYYPDDEGVFRDASGLTMADNDTVPVLAQTSKQIFNFFRCPQNGTCQVWDKVNRRCALIDTASSSSSGAVPKAAMLVNEYMGAEDLDGNGMVYGKHFYITEADRPPMLASMPEIGTRLTWQQYLATL